MSRNKARSFVLQSVQDMNQNNIEHIPMVERDSYGSYHGKYPQVAASKAYTSILKHMDKYVSYYPTYQPNMKLIIYMTETTPGKNYGRVHMYVGKRERAPQSLNQDRIIEGSDGRIRKYAWINKMSPI